MKQENYAIRLKLAKMADQCAERILSYCEQPDIRAHRGSAKTPQSLPSSQATRPVSRSASLPVASRSVNKATSLPSSPSMSRSSRSADSDDPEAFARMQNRIMFENHRRLMENANYSPTRKANLTLSLQKKMLENIVLAREKKTLLDYQLLERQERLKHVADQRIAALKMSDPTKEKQHNDLLTAIFLYDDNHKEISSLKKQLSQNQRLNCQNAKELCHSILRSEIHPLAVLLKNCQDMVEEVARPLYTKYNILVSGCIKVPLLLADSEDSEPEESSASTGSENNEEESVSDEAAVDETFERNCNIAADEVKAAIYKTDKEINKFLNDTSAPVADTTSAKIVEEPADTPDGADENDDMDSLFESDEEINESTELNCEPETDIMDKLDNRVPLPASESNLQALAEVEKSSAEFNEHLTSVTKFIHEAMHSLNTLFKLAYDSLNCEEGQDIITAAIHEHMFTPIGEHLQFLFRLANIAKEKSMAVRLTRYRKEGISFMLVKEKWLLGTNGECYLHLCRGVQDMVSIHSPLEKMSTAVKVNKGVVETTSEYYRSRGGDAVMGADDLLPIICYVLMKSELPQIVSQCAIMEEFIPAEYMMEEEGYALTTVMMAMQYLLTL